MRRMEFVLNIKCGEVLGARRTHIWGRKELKERIRSRKFN